MAFPDERDRALIRHAERLEDLATNLSDWLAEFNPSRRAVDLLPIPESDEFEVLQLRRLAGNLLTSARVPVAAAVYGPSQVGKSLFMGQVLRPHNDAYSPLARDEQYGPPAYFKDLSFDNDLNPQSGSNEATALVTRFTTKDRIAASVAPEYPVMVRALTRTEWLRVLARGFHVECQIGDRCWDQGRLENLFEEYGSLHAGREVDRKWRMDLLDAFSYMRTVDPRGFPAKEAVVSGLLSRYPLTEEGYVATAAALFWDKWPSLTNLFIRINNFLTRIASGPHGPAILTHWAGVRFLLDSQRARFHERAPASASAASIGGSFSSTSATAATCSTIAPIGPTATKIWRRSRPRCSNSFCPCSHTGSTTTGAGDRANGLLGHPRHAGRASGRRAGEADRGRIDRRADGDRQAGQGGLSLRALHGRAADPDAVPPVAWRQSGSHLPDEVPHRQVGSRPLR